MSAQRNSRCRAELVHGTRPHFEQLEQQFLVGWVQLDRLERAGVLERLHDRGRGGRLEGRIRSRSVSVDARGNWTSRCAASTRTLSRRPPASTVRSLRRDSRQDRHRVVCNEDCIGLRKD
jgi:hypothetical protein